MQINYNLLIERLFEYHLDTLKEPYNDLMFRFDYAAFFKDHPVSKRAYQGNFMYTFEEAEENTLRKLYPCMTYLIKQEMKKGNYQKQFLKYTEYLATPSTCSNNNRAFSARASHWVNSMIGRK